LSIADVSVVEKPEEEMAIVFWADLDMAATVLAQLIQFTSV
jgi:hypothetical protein